MEVVISGDADKLKATTSGCCPLLLSQVGGADCRLDPVGAADCLSGLSGNAIDQPMRARGGSERGTLFQGAKKCQPVKRG